MRQRFIVYALLAWSSAPGCVEKSSDEDEDMTSTSATGTSEETGSPLDCSECGAEQQCHSHIGVDGQCYCDAGYEWETPADLETFACVPAEPRPEDACDDPNAMVVDDTCVCSCGFTWCSDDPADLSCCPSDDSDCESTGS